MLLDLRIPGRIDEDADVAHSLQLLAEIDAGEDLLMPGKIVGMTAYDDAAEAAKQTFRESTWTLLPTSDFTDSWADTIVKCANYLKRERHQRDQEEESVDVLIVAALASEIDAIKSLDWSWGAWEPADDTVFISRGKFEANWQDVHRGGGACLKNGHGRCCSPDIEAGVDPLAEDLCNARHLCGAA